MYAINIVLRVKNEADVPRVKELITRHAALSRAEPGCQKFEVCQSLSDAKTFILIERWDSEEAINIHKTAEGYVTIYQPLVVPLVEREAHVCDILK